LGKKYNNFLFSLLAPEYRIFYDRQIKRYAKVIGDMKNELDLTKYQNVVDIGCGSGALCSVLNQKGLSVTGIDPSESMLKIALDKSKNKNITFVSGSVLDGLPFNDKYFDISIASYVAHGLQGHERKIMYAEMARITKHMVIIYDYNDSRSPVITIAEWCERGGYFSFIKNAEAEMNSCVREKKKCFSEVKVVNVDVQAAWYICTPI
jgi:ubiquinone/menaquinone biosynthesis C-methylase UbiE